ncbi:unnamed protein product [Rangifer tarandus platyrhynchus]|uniref:Uncharacterized protein n=1 Tax=Rangifer tarandus platyrhynchus TaxID=3082113 RepID=A0ACB1MMP2_RANTA
MRTQTCSDWKSVKDRRCRHLLDRRGFEEVLEGPRPPRPTSRSLPSVPRPPATSPPSWDLERRLQRRIWGPAAEQEPAQSVVIAPPLPAPPRLLTAVAARLPHPSCPGLHSTAAVSRSG